MDYVDTVLYANRKPNKLQLKKELQQLTDERRLVAEELELNKLTMRAIDEEYPQYKKLRKLNVNLQRRIIVIDNRIPLLINAIGIGGGTRNKRSSKRRRKTNKKRRRQ